MNRLSTRYQMLLEEICIQLEAGNPPWSGWAAIFGPPMLARSGGMLRGLPGVIAWHVGSKLIKPTLVWQIVAEESLKGTEEEALFLLPSHGGESIYGAIPYRRPRRLVEPVPELPEDWLTIDALASRLEEILSGLGKAAPSLEANRIAIASLAQAFLRPLGRKDLVVEEVALPRRWSPERLTQVAAWARLLADDRMLTSESDWRQHLRVTGHRTVWRRQPRENAIKKLEVIAHSFWFRGCLPAELYEPVKSAARELIPEQPVRLDIFDSKRLRRAPALGTWASWLSPAYGIWPEALVPNLIISARWKPTAALGLALAQQLGVQRLPSEPGTAWRIVGFLLRERMQKGESHPPGLEPLPGDPDQTGVVGLWHKALRDHKQSSWMHPPQKLVVLNLKDENRWDARALEQLLDEVKPFLTSKERELVSLAWLPLVRVALARRPSKQRSILEVAVRGDIANALSCEDTWESILGAAKQAQWQRYKRPKNSGGVRWLDVPSEPLRSAMRRLHDLLIAISPKDGVTTAFHPGARPALHARAHVGANASVRVDIADFFGSVRPEHLRPWLEGQDTSLLTDWTHEGRRALTRLAFLQRPGRPPYLPQGAPSSPAAANLAGRHLDHVVISRAQKAFGGGRFCYTRYADDLVLSTRSSRDADEFLKEALSLLDQAVRSQGWSLRNHKTRLWTADQNEPMLVCGLRVPRCSNDPVTLDRPTWRRARAALHRLRHRRDFGADAPGDPNTAHGLLSYAYSATGDLRWLAYTSARLAYFARVLAGPLFSESFLAGWSDDVLVASSGSVR